MSEDLHLLKENYAKTAIAQGWQLSHLAPGAGGSIKEANRAHKNNRRVANKLHSLGEGGYEALRALLRHEDPFVRYTAAGDLFRVDRELALPVLQTLARGSYGLASSMAYGELLGIDKHLLDNTSDSSEKLA